MTRRIAVGLSCNDILSVRMTDAEKRDPCHRIFFMVDVAPQDLQLPVNIAR